MATDDSGWSLGTEITLEESGASTADGVFTQANDANLTVANQTISGSIRFTHADVLLSTADTTVDPDVGGVVNVYFRPINIESAEDSPPPSVNYKNKFVVSLPIDDDEALTQAVKREIRLPNPNDECEVYIEAAFGQTLSLGWNLRIQPKSIGPAA